MKQVFSLLSIVFFLCISCDEILPADSTYRDNEWEIHASTKITYSKHAKCRMDCRFIDEEEVREILEKQTINHEKTRVNKKGTSVAFEGVTHDNQKVRIVAAKKSTNQIHIVTVIDLEKDWSCDCN